MALRLLLLISLLSPLVDLDWNVQREVQAHRMPALEGPMQWASAVGRPPLVLGGLLALALFGGPAGVETARYAALVMIPTNVVVEVTKRATNRTRPDGRSSRSNAAFPSSHAANAFALAWVLWRRWPRAGAFFYACAAFIGFSRIYLNRHFFTDVVCGAIVGIAFAWLVEVLLARAHANRAGRLPGAAVS